MINLNTPKQQNRRKTLMSLETPTYVRNTRRSTLIQRTEQSKTPLVLSQEPKLWTPPQNTKNAEQLTETPKTRLLDPVYERIQRDLNSPSAAARIRAQRALKSPGFRKANYQIFDVPHEEQDIITAEERQPYVPKTMKETFANCRIYVEVRTGDDNRSAGIKSVLLGEGINVNDKLYKNTTHVIFKDGLLSTYKQAQKMGIPVTNILWIDACRKQHRLVDPTQFPISNKERYDNPEIYGRVRRQKSMQPEISKIVTLPSSRTKKITLIDSKEDDDDDVTITNDSDMCEETVKDCTEMEMTGINKTITNESIEIVTQIEKTAEKSEPNRRLTTFTPRPMEQTNLESQAWKSVDRRRTIMSSQLGEDLTPKNTLISQTRKNLIFNSSNRIGSASRRSVLDISMNIFELNCKAISENKKKVDDVTEETDNQLDSSKNITITQTVKPAIVRKRKLFSTDHDDSIEYKENCNTPENDVSIKKKLKRDISASTKTIKVDKKSKISGALDRRKTISFFKARDKIDESNANCKSTPTKPTPKYIVCTNMTSADREMAQAAITKLGGILEKEVTEKTTHVITPNTERTMNLLRGIIRACYILKSDWITESVKAGMFLDTTMYQHEICNNQKICERSILGKNFKNHSFSHYGPFYINKDTIDNLKKYEYVKEIIKLCNGNLTSNINDAKMIVSDRPLILPLSLKKPTVVISTYIFDAAMQGKLIPNAKYIPKVA
ncbi:uncharacterized protein MCPH1 [Chironomus tepperi]|uniref:uncharacterized protein MCPH1 n=1 Tax=Chironomus tepperi TaxID=113505 RepID=UPI00391F49C6